MVKKQPTPTHVVGKERFLGATLPDRRDMFTVHFDHGQQLITNVLEIADGLPATIREILADPTSDWTEKEHPERPAALFEVGLLHPHSGALAASYNILRDTLTSTTGIGRKREHVHSLTTRLAAAMIFDTMFHQTTRPPSEKAVFVGIPDEVMPQVEADIRALHQDPKAQATNASERTFTQTISAVEELILGIKSRLEADTSSDTFAGQLADLDALIATQDGTIFDIHRALGTPHVSNAIVGLYEQNKKRILSSSFARATLANGQLTDAHEQVRFATILYNVENIYAGTIPTENERAAILSAFLDDHSLHKIFWKRIRENNALRSDIDARGGTIQRPAFYQNLEPFFLHNREILEEFIDTAAFADLAPTEQAMLFKRLIGMAAVFQRRYPEHIHTEYLRHKIAATASAVGQQETVRDYLEILSDETPGSIYLDSHGTLRMRRSESHPSDLYVSKAEPETPTTSEPTHRVTNEPIVVFSSFERADAPVEVPNWGMLYEPQPTEVARLLAELTTKFNNTDQDWFVRTDNARKEMSARPHTQAMVLPNLLHSGHPLSELAKIGILAVQRNDHNYSVIIDTQTAGITVGNQPQIVLRATLEEGYLQFSSGDTEKHQFEVDSLHLALSEAAFLSHYRQQGKVEEFAERQADIARASLDWNRDNRFKRPRALTISLNLPDSTDTAVIVPVTKDNKTVAVYKID